MKCIYAHGSKVKQTNRKCSIHISNSRISIQNQFLNTHEGLVGPGKDSRQWFSSHCRTSRWHQRSPMYWTSEFAIGGYQVHHFSKGQPHLLRTSVCKKRLALIATIKTGAETPLPNASSRICLTTSPAAFQLSQQSLANGRTPEFRRCRDVHVEFSKVQMSPDSTNEIGHNGLFHLSSSLRWVSN